MGVGKAAYPTQGGRRQFLSILQSLLHPPGWVGQEGGSPPSLAGRRKGVTGGGSAGKGTHWQAMGWGWGILGWEGSRYKKVGNGVNTAVPPDT